MSGKIKSIHTYFILTFLISWLCWSPLYFFSDVSEFWVLPGAWGPTIAAFIVTYFEYGRTGIKRLFRKLLIWKVPVRYYLFSIFALLVLGAASLLIYNYFTKDLINPSTVLVKMGLSEQQMALGILLFPIFFLINTLIGGPIAEELGWRGYAQEMLQQKYNPNITGIIIGLFWSLWHLPLIVFLPQAVGHMPIWGYLPLMTAMGLIFSWLYNRTNGSVLLAIFFHGSMNFTHGFLGSDFLSNHVLLCLQVALVIALAIILSINNPPGKIQAPIAGKEGQ